MLTDPAGLLPAAMKRQPNQWDLNGSDARSNDPSVHHVSVDKPCAVRFCSGQERDATPLPSPIISAAHA
jgi:hypothetical protein